MVPSTTPKIDLLDKKAAREAVLLEDKSSWQPDLISQLAKGRDIKKQGTRSKNPVFSYHIAFFFWLTVLQLYLISRLQFHSVFKFLSRQRHYFLNAASMGLYHAI